MGYLLTEAPDAGAAIQAALFSGLQTQRNQKKEAFMRKTRMQIRQARQRVFLQLAFLAMLAALIWWLL